PALAAPPPSWEAPLRALIGAPAARTTGAPLAIELSLQAAGGSTAGAPRLLARLMRPGARGGWINGSLSWNALDSWQVRDATLRADHLGLVRELHAIHRAREGRAYYSYGYGSDRTIELGVCESPQLWSLLDDAERLGLELIHARAELGPVRRHRGEVVLDVTRDGDLRSLVRAVARIDDRDDRGLEPQLFVGSAGHGLVCVQAGDADMASWRLHLVALERPVPAQLQRMVLDSEALSIPTGELEGFAAEIWPALRHVAPVISSDGSFSPPEISAPELVLRASYGDGHLAQLGWEWAYQVGDETRRAPLALNGDGPGFRDPAAERARLDAAALGDTTLADLGLLDLDGRPAARTPVLLAGLEVARLTSEQLPALTELPGVTVEIGGEPADYRDVDDALEIGVSATAEGAGARDWFDLGVTITVEGRELPFADVFVALAGGEPRMLLDDGAHFSLQAPRLQALRRLIEEARALTDSPSGPLRLSRYQAGLWQELVALGVVTEQAQEWQRAVQALVSLGEIEQREPPAGLCARLRPYQCEGFGWLALLLELELGGILADDMGLGKTVQTLAMICHARDRQPDAGPFLVVAPTSVVPGWVGETARFAPRLRIEAVTDTLARSGRQIAEIADADIVVTTYTLLRLEAETYRGVAWAGVILDEAQAVKNHQTKTHRAVRELRAPFKLAVTGTPMENNLMELWALLSITAPGLFPDPKRFSEHYARPIERARDGERLERLRRRIRPLVKRRTKELVATDLPPKQEQTLTVDLHPRHRKLYDTHLQRERQRILGLIGDFDKNRFTILRSITLLRQLSLHPGLVDSGHDNVPCAKLAALAEHLEEVAGGGHRALVFSQFTGFLAKVRERLDHDGVEYCYLDGSTRRRDLVLERFRSESVPVFLISLKAGGFGLNLTEADYCFLLDPWWNPAAETQAIDRTHRIGQTRPVMVYRTISRDTIEEKVVALAQRKAALFRGVMDDGDLFAGSLTVDDIRGLVS
ncbi:MAG: DEAD/DEAH box helicase, partial [Solirubrobacteraceae bacterium]